MFDTKMKNIQIIPFMCLLLATFMVGCQKNDDSEESKKENAEPQAKLEEERQARDALSERLNAMEAQISKSADDGDLADNPRLVKVEAHFVSFKSKDIERIASQHGSISVDMLSELRKEGKSKLLSAPQITTINGVNAVIEVVREIIYPTEFDIVPVTNAQSVGGYVLKPGQFKTREVGCILNVTARLSPNGEIIHLTLLPERASVSEPETKNYGMIAAGKKLLPMEQPLFSSQTLTTSVAIKNGETLVFGGGFSTKSREDILYIFIRAEIIYPGHKEYEGHHYKVFTDVVSWHEARDKCEAMGGYLACVGSADENTFLAKLKGNLSVWLGGTDEAHEGRWKWVDGAQFTYQNWYGPNPNNFGNGEDFLQFGRHGNRVDDGWNDAPPRGYRKMDGFICEWEK
jgi:hypothetical protein